MLRMQAAVKEGVALIQLQHFGDLIGVGLEVAAERATDHDE